MQSAINVYFEINEKDGFPFKFTESIAEKVIQNFGKDQKIRITYHNFFVPCNFKVDDFVIPYQKENSDDFSWNEYDLKIYYESHFCKNNDNYNEKWKENEGN